MDQTLLYPETELVRDTPVKLSLGDHHYLLLWPEQFGIPNIDESTFLTVFEFNEQGPVDLNWITRTVKTYSNEDDVFQSDFLKAILFSHNSATDLTVTNEATTYLHEQGTTNILTHQATSRERKIAPGPYYYSTGGLRSVWKLYEDTHCAFLQSLVLDQRGEPYNLRTAGITPETLTVAVPTKIRSQEEDPRETNSILRGWRIAVKDNFQIQHVRRSACNRAYFELYPPAQETATCIQALYDMGATVVGTTKLASFAATEEPIECIDWQAPFNPRADMYQSPAGSSSGSGVAIAAYEWLDITVGSDTSGSGRRPGHWNGCFAMRPSHGYLSCHGLLDSFPRFDMPTFFGRELERCKIFAEAWYGKDLPEQCYEVTDSLSIVWALDYMNVIGNEQQLELLKAFAKDLESTLEVKHQAISFEEAWENYPPKQANGESLSDYMKDVSRDSFFYEDYHNFDTFREDYRDKFGRDAYISPPVRWQWELSSHITSEAHAEAMVRLEVYKDWFDEVVMKLGKQTALVLIPIEEISPRYRDEAPATHFNPVGVPNLFLSPILKAPELTVPIGEVTYTSKVTGNQEKLPVAVSVIGPPGKDIVLFDLILKCLHKSGRPNRVLPGRKLFPDTGL